MDLAADPLHDQLGLCLALAFILLAIATGNTVFDAIGSICIGIVLVVISVFLAVRIRALLVGRSADPIVQAAIDEVIAEEPGIVRVFNTITLQLGPDTMLAAKIQLADGVDLHRAVTTINDLERRLKEKVPDLKWCFVEPDVTD